MRRSPFVSLTLLMALGVLTDGCLPPGSGGDGGSAVAAVQPSSIARGRTKSVRVRGAGTEWTTDTINTTNVAFGEGIIVNTVTVANARTLLVDITADAAGVAGLRDVTVAGETLTGGFQLTDPILVSEITPLTPGSFFALSLTGFDTDWVDGSTTVTLGGGLLTDGVVLDRPLHVDVIRTDALDVFGYVPLNATAGTADLTVAGAQLTDTVPAALTIESLAATVLAADVSSTIDTPLSPELYQINAAFGSDLHIDLAAATGIADPIAYLFRAGVAGTTPEAVLQPGTSFDTIEVAAGGETFYLSVFDRTLGGGTGFDFAVNFTNTALTTTAIASGTPLMVEMLAAAGDVNWYDFDTTDPWVLGDVDISPTFTGGGGSTLDPVLLVEREGATEVVVDDNNQTDTRETTRVLVGNVPTGLLGVKDATDASNGMQSLFQVDWTETAIAGTCTTSADLIAPLADSIAPGVNGVTTSTTSFVSANNIDEARIVVEITHPHIEELEIEVRSPDNTTVQLLAPASPDAPGLVEAFSEDAAGGTVQVGNLSNLNGEAAGGMWTLTITDDVPGDAGVLRAWGVCILEL